MPQVLVLGAAGAIGAHAVRALISAGWSVRAFTRPSTDLAPLSSLAVDVAHGDVADAPSVRAALTGCEALVHAAGWYPTSAVEPALAARRGRESLEPVLRAARDAGVRRVVYVSSAGTLGTGRRPSPRPGRRRPVDPRVPFAGEDDPPPDPGRGGYTAAKLAMERAALAAAADGLPVVVVNPTLCLGEHDRKPTSGRVVLAVLRGRVPAAPPAPLNVVWTGNVGRGIAAALERGRPGERYALGGANTTLLWLVRQVAFEGGVRAPSPLPRLPNVALAGAGRLAAAAARWTAAGLSPVALELLAGAQHVDTAKAERELRLPPASPAVEIVRRTVAWFRGAPLDEPRPTPR